MIFSRYPRNKVDCLNYDIFNCITRFLKLSVYCRYINYDFPTKHALVYIYYLNCLSLLKRHTQRDLQCLIFIAPQIRLYCQPSIFTMFLIWGKKSHVNQAMNDIWTDPSVKTLEWEYRHEWNWKVLRSSTEVETTIFKDIYVKFPYIFQKRLNWVNFCFANRYHHDTFPMDHLHYDVWNTSFIFEYANEVFTY